jgi:hypothetical protein
MSLPNQRGVPSLSTDVIGEALRELILDRKTQDSKKRLFFCFHQAHEFSTASVPPDESLHVKQASS